MPDDYYVSQYSGEEIDAVLSSAGAGTVRYDAAQTLTDAQKTQARTNINSAPGGFGWGDSAQYTFETNEEFKAWFMQNAALKCTRNAFAASVHITNVSNFRMLIIASGNTSTSGIVIVGYTYNGDELRLVLDDYGNWGHWEWVNPPMQLGVEYRTTERYQGKPVYAKRIFCESMPSGAGYIDIQPSNTEVPNALISTAIVIRCYGRASVATTIPFYSSSGDFMQVGVVENCKIRIYTAKAYGGTADITVHYVKSTD